jgi:O-acetyl-ADP-ribose deacetylase (regulator of RNase III)
VASACATRLDDDLSQIVREIKLFDQIKFQLVQGDLTEEHVDAIVNAANQYLQHGGGVAGAILRRGGPVIQQESSRWVRQHGVVPHDHPAYTSAGRLPCRYVIHAVGPVWGSGEEDEKLAAAVKGSLDLADQLSLNSIAIPAISTGIYGFPKEQAASVIINSIRDHFKKETVTNLTLVRIVIIDQPTMTAFKEIWDSTPFE